MSQIKSKVRKLMKIYQPEQRSKEWFELRKEKITASSAASLLIKDKLTCEAYIKEFDLPESFADNKPANPYSSKTEYILTKCGVNKFTGSVATYHGTMFEQIACDLYSKRSGKNVIEFGLLPHPEISFLAASPDGITEDGVMLEIKCPYRRKINGVIPFYYWVQIQLQLEVANLKRCDYLECELEELKGLNAYQNVILEEGQEKGLFLEIRPKNLRDRSESRYIYPDKNEQNLLSWSEKKMKKFVNTEKNTISIVYWKLNKYAVIRTVRNKEWFNHIIKILEKEWQDVLHYKHNGHESLIKVEKPLNIITFNDIDASNYEILSDSDSN